MRLLNAVVNVGKHFIPFLALKRTAAV